MFEFSIIVPVWHSGKLLENALKSIERIDFPPGRFEVIVAGKQDDLMSRSIVEKTAAAVAFDMQFIGCLTSQRAHLLNAACRTARGRILAFVADDCTIRRSWLQTFYEIFSDGVDIGVVGGQDDLEHSESTFAIAVNHVLKSFMGTGGMRHASGLRTGIYYPKLWNMAVSRTEAFDVALLLKDGQTQVFDETLSVHEDVDLGKRIARKGRRIIFSPDARVRYKRDRTWGLFFTGNFRKARASRTLGVHYLAHMVLSTFVLSIPVLLAASFFSPHARMVFWTEVSVYLLLLLFSGIGGLLRTQKISVFVMVPVLLISLHFARGLGYLFPLKRRGRSHQVIM